MVRATTIAKALVIAILLIFSLFSFKVRAEGAPWTRPTCSSPSWTALKPRACEPRGRAGRGIGAEDCSTKMPLHGAEAL